MRFELAGNRMRVRRPPSILTSAHETLFGAAPMAEVRPMSTFAVNQVQSDADPRYRPDNIASFDLEFLAGTTQPFNPGAPKLGVSTAVRSVIDAPSMGGPMAVGDGAEVGSAKARRAAAESSAAAAGSGDTGRERKSSKSSSKR